MVPKVTIKYTRGMLLGHTDCILQYMYFYLSSQVLQDICLKLKLRIKIQKYKIKYTNIDMKQPWSSISVIIFRTQFS